MQPKAMPITGPQRRNTSDPRRVRAATTTRVANAVKGAATGSASEASSSSPKTY